MKLNGSHGVATRFSSTNQPDGKLKSEGLIKYNLRKKLMENLAIGLFNVHAPERAIEGALASLEMGDAKPLIKLLELIKLPDKQELQMSGNVQVMPTVKVGGKELDIKIGEEPNGDGTSDNS